MNEERLIYKVRITGSPRSRDTNCPSALRLADVTRSRCELTNAVNTHRSGDAPQTDAVYFPRKMHKLSAGTIVRDRKWCPETIEKSR